MQYATVKSCGACLTCLAGLYLRHTLLQIKHRRCVYCAQTFVLVFACKPVLLSLSEPCVWQGVL